jgi:hypothetical protein
MRHRYELMQCYALSAHGSHQQAYFTSVMTTNTSCVCVWKGGGGEQGAEENVPT